MDRILRSLPIGLMAAFSALLLLAGPAGTLLAGEFTPWPGPELKSPAQPLKSLSPAGNPTTNALVEMPIAETATAIAPSQTTAPPKAVLKTSPPANAEKSCERSVQVERVAQQADRQTRHGFELAGRGAFFAARAQFIAALRLVAEALDGEQKGDSHSRALAASLLAMKEAEDFMPRSGRIEADLDLPGIIAAHATPALKNDGEKATPLTALRRYLTFAQEQFAAAAGREVAGSMALHALGKLHAAMAQKKGALIVAPESKAMVFYQSALLVCPQNYMAANDLGVLLARCGYYADARSMFEHSLTICPQSAGWQNLAVVHRQLGQAALAERATGQAAFWRQRELARRQVSPSVNGLVRWLDQPTFAQTSTNMPNSPVATVQPPIARPPTYAAPSAFPAGESQLPAPTPAAAQRRSWAAPIYER